jgi:hypothetical protein
MLQWLYTYVAKVCYQCFIYVFRTHVASVFIWMLHIFHTYVACVFLGVSVACFNCFIYLYVATAEFGCFKSRFWVLHLSSPSVASSWCVPHSTPAGHSYDAATGSFQIEGAARPFFSCRSDGADLVWSAWGQVQRTVRPYVQTLILPKI